jgi:hypothetical protein
MAREVHKDRVNADLAELDKLRRYLISKSESGGLREELLAAIDDYVEALTGDRRALHGQNSRNLLRVTAFQRGSSRERNTACGVAFPCVLRLQFSL